jgi:hypothetical protein
MSGFDISRFIDLSESNAKHMSCSICLGIYCKPVETQCGHTFCQQCIKQWINQNNNSCPQCRQQLANKRKRNSRNNNNSIDESVMFWETNRNFVYLINDLKIKCDFVSNGCKEVLELGSLSKHLEECNYNLCISCGLKMGKKVEHNCIELLKKERDYYKQQSIDSQNVAEKYKHELNDTKNQLIIQSISFNDIIKKEKINFEKEKQKLKEKVLRIEEKISIICNKNEMIANVLTDCKVISALLKAIDCDKRTESEQQIQKRTEFLQKKRSEWKEKQNFQNNKLIKCIKDGKVDEHLISLYRECIPSKRHQRFKNGSKSGRNQLKHKLQCFGPIDNEEQQEVIYDYLSQLFKYEFELNSSLDNFYIIQVLVPESIVKAINIVHRIKLKEAEFLFVNYSSNLFNFNRIIKKIQNEAQKTIDNEFDVQFNH